MQTQAQPTLRFIDIWTYLALSAVGAVVVAGFASLLMFRPLVETTLQAQAEETARLSPIQIQPQSIGALRVNVTAIVPTNRWVTYEIQLRDQEEKLLASAIKQAWNEAGVWREGGEAGSWQEDDLNAGLDIQPAKPEKVTIAIAVLDYATTRNQAIEEPLSFRIKVQEGIIDNRYLWNGFFGTGLLAILAMWATAMSGTKVLSKTQPDSEVNDRTILGGPRTLVQVTVLVNADEHTPPKLNCRLRIRDGNGQPVYDRADIIPMRRARDNEGEIDSAKGKLVAYFVLKPRNSYGLSAEVTPDLSVDSTQIVVKEGVRTFHVVDVVQIESEA